MDSIVETAAIDEEKNVDFEEILKNTISEFSNYEKKSIMLIFDLFGAVMHLEENKLSISKHLIDDIDKLLMIIKSSKGSSSDISSIINEIKLLQSNLSNYIETTDKDVLKSINDNIYNINEFNKKLLIQNRNSSEKELYGGEQIFDEVEEGQKIIKEKIEQEIKKQTKILMLFFKPFDFKKLDEIYIKLYNAIQKNRSEDVIYLRGRLINELKKNDKKMDSNYKEISCLVRMREIFNSSDEIEVKLQKINQLLQEKENNIYYKYFVTSINNYDELRKNFNSAYEYMNVSKLELYKNALKDELKLQNRDLIKMYENELVGKKRTVTVLTNTLPKTLLLSIKKLNNSIERMRNAKTNRSKSAIRKEIIGDLGRVMITPGVCTIKFITSNWYTLLLLLDGYKTIKEQKETIARLKDERASESQSDVESELDEQHLEDDEQQEIDHEAYNNATLPINRTTDVVEDGYIEGVEECNGYSREIIPSTNGVGGNIYKDYGNGVTERITVVKKDGKYVEVVQKTVDRTDATAFSSIRTHNMTQYNRVLSGQLVTYTFTYENGTVETMTVVSGSETSQNYWNSYFRSKCAEGTIPNMYEEGTCTLKNGGVVNISYSTSDNEAISQIVSRENVSQTYYDYTNGDVPPNISEVSTYYPSEIPSDFSFFDLPFIFGVPGSFGLTLIPIIIPKELLTHPYGAPDVQTMSC